MSTLLILILAAVGYGLSYKLYGGWLSKKVFRLDPDAVTPAHRFNDGADFVPTRTEVLFGHHFTTIAGTGPIVGPAIAVIWGWLPALIWVIVGPIFMGAVHDFGAIVISSRHRARSIGEVAEELISPRVRTLFLLIIFFALFIVLAVFGWVIAVIFNQYPQSVIPIWAEIPIALLVAWGLHKKGMNLRLAGILGVAAMYVFVYVGFKVPFTMPPILGLHPTVIWIALLLIYSYIASTIPVQALLQPRDYLNSHQLFIIMGLLIAAFVTARPEIVAPAYAPHPPGAPPLLPMLFVIVACGAISGFHSLAGSGTTSKQLNKETDALPVGYGSMLLEGFLAVMVILACTAGFPSTQAWSDRYHDFATAGTLGAMLGSFVEGAAYVVSQAFGISHGLMVTIMGVFVASFAATTLDSATRIQRYVVAELAESVGFKPLTGKHAATGFAVLTAALLAFSQAEGKGALALWPLFGTTNQLLAGLSFLVIFVYLVRTERPAFFVVIPMIFMIVMTGWAMVTNLDSYYEKSQWHLFIVGGLVLILEIWMIFETLNILRKQWLPGATSSQADSV